MSHYNEILKNIQQHIENLFSQCNVDYLLYHNLAHTNFVVERTKEITANYSLDESEHFIVSASAWFHDTGQLTGDPQFHEERSVSIMKRFIEGREVFHSVIDKIESCICATKLFQKPKSLLEEILCDADTYNLGTKDFTKTDELLKNELLYRGVDTSNWVEKTLQLLRKHKYFTPYCQSVLNAGKQENIRLMKSNLQDK